MGKASRAKGAAGERELANLLKARGHNARRTAQMQAGWGGTQGDADVAGLPGVHLEVKRCERVQIDQWCGQAERDAPDGAMPWTVWRRSRQPWRVAMLVADALAMFEELTMLRARVAETEDGVA